MQAEAKGFDAQILGQVIRTNTERPQRIAKQIGQHLNNCIQQQENEQDYELNQKIEENKYYYYGLEDFKQEDEYDNNQKSTHYEMNTERKVYYCDDPPTEYTTEKKEDKK